MISTPVFLFEKACIDVPYPIEAPPECQGAKVVKFVVANPLPFGVTADDVVFSNQYGLASDVTFPKEDDYYICMECYN